MDVDNTIAEQRRNHALYDMGCNGGVILALVCLFLDWM